MKVAIDASPLKSGHKVRGIGMYTQKLMDEFKKEDWGIDFEFFENPAYPPPADLIHYPYFDLFMRTLPAKKNINRVVTIHDVIPLVFPENFPVGIKGYINLFFQKRTLKKSDAIICDSQTSKQDIADKLSIPQEKIHVIYLAPSENFKKINSHATLENLEKKYNLPEKFVLYVGDVNWNKNLPNILRSIEILKINLVLVGEAIADSSIKETNLIDNLAQKLEMEDKIIKTGFVPENDLIGLYNLAQLTLLPSFYEGFGLPLLESMACGTPVVCSNNSSLAEISGDTAVFCDPTDPKDIAKKVAQVLKLSAKERQLLAAKCQIHSKKFTWGKVAQETIEVYKGALK